MSRYNLMDKFPGDEEKESEVKGKRKSTKAEIESWIADMEAAYGLDWRVGYMVKFKNSPCVYTWRRIKDGLEVKP